MKTIFNVVEYHTYCEGSNVSNMGSTLGQRDVFDGSFLPKGDISSQNIWILNSTPLTFEHQVG